jgi:hypothetical protein
MNKVFLVLMLILTLASCKKERLITYVVTSNSPVVISYRNEFGEFQEDLDAAKIGKSDQLNWKQEFAYSEDRFGTLGQLYVSASALEDYPCYVHAKIYVNNTLVADTSMYADEIGEKSRPVELKYEI